MGHRGTSVIITIMKAEILQKQSQIDGLREAIKELESSQASGEMPGAHGIGYVGVPLSFEERLSMTKKRLAELEAES
jgi:hypothetical protein